MLGDCPGFGIGWIERMMWSVLGVAMLRFGDRYSGLDTVD